MNSDAHMKIPIAFTRKRFRENLRTKRSSNYVVEQLVENRAWLVAANNMGLTVADDELREVDHADP